MMYMYINSRLTETLKKETTFHQEETGRLHQRGQKKVADEVSATAEKEHSNEYLTHLERLHLQVCVCTATGVKF